MADVAQPSNISETAPEPQPMAPLWHTALLILILLGLSAGSYLSSRRFVPQSSHAGAPPTGAMLLTYGATLAEEWILFLIVLWGERMRSRVTVRERIGARREKDALVRDIGIAAGVWGTLALVGGTLGYFLHPSGKEIVAKLLPRNLPELALWTAVAVSAGFCEEYIFRGYLQRQFALLTGSIWAGVVIQAVIFGLGHGYQGPALMLTIFCYGLIFGAAAKWRKSLRPTMIAHGWTDLFSGFAGYIGHVMHLF